MNFLENPILLLLLRDWVNTEGEIPPPPPKSFSLTPVPRVRKARHRTRRKRRRAEAGVRAIGPLPASLTTLVVVDVAVLTF
jgi:hypothetical protein